MSYFKVCPNCGAHLDPCERCDCTLTQVCAETRAAFPERFAGRTDQQIVNEIASVVQRSKKTAPSAANTEDGRAEKGLESSDSASIVQ